MGKHDVHVSGADDEGVGADGGGEVVWVMGMAANEVQLCRCRDWQGLRGRRCPGEARGLGR